MQCKKNCFQMKFGKEFTSQMVHEWQEAYMDYNYLKNLLKDILDFKKKNAPLSEVAATPEGSLKRRISMYRAFSGLQSRYTSFKGSSGNNNNNHEDEVILVNTVQQEGSQGCHQTMFLMSSEEGGEYEMIFFKRLDDEFNKVLTFYKKKVGQVKAEADELSKQMDALIALRIVVDKPSIEMHIRSHMEVIQEVEMSSEEIVEDESTSGKRDTTKMNPMGFRPAPVEILDNVKINIEPATPISTLKNVIKSSKSDLSFSRQELRKAEEQIRMAFVEFYQKLRLLKNYRVEATFIKHFVNGNRRKGMKSLRPQAKRDTHRVTFFMGMFSGCSIALVAAIAVAIRAGNLLEHKDRGQYMDNIFPLYSLFGYIVLHMLMYAGNVYYWKRFRVNYPFIFGFKQGTALGYRQVLILASGLSLLALAAALSHLDMDMDPKTRKFETLTELIPLALCLRRFFEEKDSMQGLNGLKYFSTIVALVMRTLYSQKGGTFWRVMAASTSGVTTVANTYWDLKKNAPLPEVAATPRGSLKRRLSMYRAFNGLQTRYNSFKGKNNHEDEVIVVKSVQQEGSECHYETTFLVSCEEGGECELIFFRTLDDEFNKVLTFYKKKVGEVKVEADELSKQMDALIALRIKVDKISVGAQSVQEAIQEVEMTSEEILEEEATIGKRDTTKMSPGNFRPASLEVLDYVKINIEPETPISTLRCIVTSKPNLSFSKEELRKVEEQMKKAFVSKLMEGVEATFIKHFVDGNRKKGMKYLRPQAQRETHRVTFLLGLFSGGSLALVAAIAVSIRAGNLLENENRGQYMENIFPLYSLFGFVVLHMVMYGANIYYWRRFRVNYPFIFGFKQGTELGYRQVLLLASGLSLLALAAALYHLDMDTDPKTQSFQTKRGTFWRVMAASTSGVTTVANTYWDLVIDWGLLQRNSKNPWLRDKLLVPYKIVYFVAIVLNIILRLVWMQLVLDFQELPFLHRRAFIAIVACLEILRRGMWNFFRLENEHLNNVGKYRASKSVPLPFNYDEDKSM
ncbi:hypothetical protein RDI58_006339 [Solanum bulbocastanum]|uniref:Uncharacterized protein n=1 Tax=Solanum bulbocastanum TaxID=147425 RepID=A0AAN8U960_SOLBU